MGESCCKSLWDWGVDTGNYEPWLGKPGCFFAHFTLSIIFMWKSVYLCGNK